MKSLHRPDLFAWSAFDEARNVDFNGTFWRGPEGGVAIDPMPLSDHDRAHLESLGGVAWVLISNADHVRAATDFVQHFGAKLAAPAGDRERPELSGLSVDRWLSDGEEIAGVRSVGLSGSKTPGELSFLLPGGTLVCGDLVRGQRAGALNLLPDPKLADKAAAHGSVLRLAALEGLEAVLVGDGQSVFSGAPALLRAAVGG